MTKIECSLHPDANVIDIPKSWWHPFRELICMDERHRIEQIVYVSVSFRLRKITGSSIGLFAQKIDRGEVSLK